MLIIINISGPLTMTARISELEFVKEDVTLDIIHIESNEKKPNWFFFFIVLRSVLRLNSNDPRLLWLFCVSITLT